MKQWRILLSVICLSAAMGTAQLAVVKTERLPLKTNRAWTMPQWSPDGMSLFFTTTDYNGIWAYSMRARTTTLITPDRQSGYGFSISPDGRRIAYRRTLSVPHSRERRQEAVVKDLADGSITVLTSGGDLAVPSFANTDVVYSNGTTTLGVTQSAQAGTTALLGTEDNRIAILRDGVKTLLDPLGGNGRYIWPALSPDRKRLVAYDMERGTVVADADGSNPVRLGKRNAAVWTRDGRWLVYMDDRDDGHTITGSEIACVTPDGKVSARLTSTRRRTEMYPQCSPTADRIVCSTLEGEILVLTYAEAGR